MTALETEVLGLHKRSSSVSKRGGFTFTLFQQYVSINNALRNFQEPPAKVKGMSNIKTN